MEPSESTKPASRHFRPDYKKLLANTPSLLAGLGLLLCAVYASTLSTTPKLQVLSQTSGTGFIEDIDAYEEALGPLFSSSLSNRSKLLIDTNKIAADIQDENPELGEVSVNLPLIGRRPVVQVRPAQPALVMGTLDDAVVVGRNGRIIASAKGTESSVLGKLPVVLDESGLEIERGGYALQTESVELIVMVYRQLTASQIKVQSITLPAIANEMHIRLEGEPYFAKFDLRGDGRVQAGTLIAAKKKLDTDGTKPRQYIDVRVTGKAFFK